MNTGMAVIPPGGFRFFQRLPNGSMMLFVGLGKEDLIKQVTTFRLNNNIDLGDVAVEIDKGISGASHKVPGDQRTLRERVTGWKSNRAYKPLEFVEPEEAERRAKICVDCPYNRVKYADDCIECFSSVERDLYAMRQGKGTEQDPWLGACEVCGHENKTAVHLDGADLLHRKNFESELKEKKPDCWLLQLDKSEPKGGE
jgi:hypothetical protein